MKVNSHLFQVKKFNSFLVKIFNFVGDDQIADLALTSILVKTFLSKIHQNLVTSIVYIILQLMLSFLFEVLPHKNYPRFFTIVFWLLYLKFLCFFNRVLFVHFNWIFFTDSFNDNFWFIKLSEIKIWALMMLNDRNVTEIYV